MAVQQRDWNQVADAAEARVSAWISALDFVPPHAEGAGNRGAADGNGTRHDLLEGSRRDSDAFAFTRRLLDSVVGASDPFSAALGLREASRELPPSMPAVERIAVRAGGLASLGLPWAVLPVARKWLRDRVAHLVLSAQLPDSAQEATKLAAVLDVLRIAASEGCRVLLAPTGIEVMGDNRADLELHRLLLLAAQPEVRELAVDVSRLVATGPAGAWSLDLDAEVGAARLRELLEVAQRGGVAILVESSDYRTSLLAPQLLIKALDAPGLERVRVGVALPAELPESLQTADALVQFSRARVADGAEPIEIAIGVAGFSGHEQVQSVLTGLPIPTLEQHDDHTAQLLRVLSLLFDAADAVRVTVASEDPHVLAAATVLAEGRKRTPALTLQVRAGTVTELEAVIAEHGYDVRRRLPVVPPKEFAGAVAYLIALAAETADSDSPLSHARALLARERGELDRGADRLRDAIALAVSTVPASRRRQQREREWSEDARDTVVFYRAPADQSGLDTGGLTAAVLGLTRAQTGAITLEVAGPPLRVPVVSGSGFANEPDTDGSRFENRAWVRGLLARARHSDAAITAVRSANALAEEPERLITEALAGGKAWHDLRHTERGTRVSRLALGTASARDQLIEVLAAESGAPIAVLDAEVNGAIDAARYLGQLAGGLGAVRGAQFQADRLALVVADAGTPLAERAEAMLAALSAGSALIVAVHPSVARSTAVIIEEWQAAGLPEGAVSLAVVSASEDPRTAHLSLAVRIAADPRIDRALVLGGNETARALLRRRPDLRIEGRFRAPGVIAVTPSADPGHAVRQIVTSAFGALHASPSTARVVVLLGAAARSRQLRQGLVDALTSLQVGDTARLQERDPLALGLGPLPEPPDEAGLRALTELGPGEEWLLKPERLDDEGMLWRPGVRFGVTRDSRFWADSVGMPVLGVIVAHTVDEMISLTNQLGGGGVAALLASDPAETLPWLERARAARLCVGKATTGERIERQPSGGWGAAGSGASVLAGGPNRLQTLGSWELREGTSSATLHLRGLAPEVRVLIENSQPSLDYQSFDRVRRAALSDALTWRSSLGRAYDVSGLGIERNLLRHWPVSTHVRLAEASQIGDLVRVLAAGFVAGAPMTVSTGVVLPPELAGFLAAQGVSVSLERDEAWLERIAVNGPGADGLSASRIRLIGGDRVRTTEWLGGLGKFTVWAEPVTMAGPVELLAFLREQSISIAAHRQGLALLPAGVGGWIDELQGRD